MIRTMDAGASTRVGTAWIAPVALFVAAALLYGVGLGRLPHPDEYHHLLAAQGIVNTGEPRIAEGIYTRVLLHSWLVAQSFELFGQSLAAARVPSLLAMAALVAILFAWMRRECGPLAAWIGTLLFATSPFAADVATFIRFYALQALAFFLGAVLAYLAVEPSDRRMVARTGLGATSAASLVLAIYLQPTTLLGLCGLGLWVALALGLPWLADGAVPRRHKVMAAGGLAVLACAALIALIATGLLAELWRQYRWAPLFNRSNAGEFWYYHAWYNLLYPTLWPLSGVLVIAALSSRFRPAAMATLVFALGFLLNSFAASKSLRYIAYAQPFLFIIWGMGLAVIVPPVLTALRDVSFAALTRIGMVHHRPAAAKVLVGAALLFLFVANPAWLRTATTLADLPAPGEQPRTDWLAARDELRPWLQRADVVISTEELGQLYFLGRYDIRFSPSKLDELPDAEQHEFGRDPRTGRPVIGTRESLEQVFDCYPSGIIVGPAAHWGRPELISNELAPIIAERAQLLPLPPRSRLRAYVWEHAVAPGDAARCQGLPTFRHLDDPAPPETP